MDGPTATRGARITDTSCAETMRQARLDIIQGYSLKTLRSICGCDISKSRSKLPGT